MEEVVFGEAVGSSRLRQSPRKRLQRLVVDEHEGPQGSQSVVVLPELLHLDVLPELLLEHGATLAGRCGRERRVPRSRGPARASRGTLTRGACSGTCCARAKGREGPPAYTGCTCRYRQLRHQHRP
eukprot:234502-Hanusia_phi.AAC.2